MTPAFRTLVAALLVAGALAPAARAAPPQRALPTTPEALTAQERDLLAVATELARQCGETMEKWLAAREVSEEQLFSFLYYPQPRTDPPKFNTDWDRLSDRDLIAAEEAALARSPMVVYAVFTDRNAYVPTHNRKFAQPLTQSPAMDLVNNRTKRMFVDAVGVAAARSEAPFLVQRYQRDTGELIMDLSVPVTVRGKHFGAVRIGYRPVDAK